MKNLATITPSNDVKNEVLFFENRLLDYKGASQFLGISIRHLRNLKSTGEIKHVLIGSGERGVRFRVASLMRFIDEREVS